jgi:hypothetical protein
MGIEGAHLATPDVIKQGVEDLGDTYNKLSARNTLVVDPQLKSDLANVAAEYGQSVLPSQARPVVGNTLSDIADWGNTVQGSTYQDIRSKLTKQAQSYRLNDPQASQALAGIRDALDSAMGRSISPEDAQEWANTNRQYANYKTIEKAISGAGAETAQGYISPAQLRTAAAIKNRGQYAQGQSDLGELGRAGVGVMTPLPQSGTAPRMWNQHLLGIGGALLGGVPGAAAGIAADVAGPAIAGRALMSPMVQGYLKNQLVSGWRTPSSPAALAAALLGDKNRRLPATP